jgi:hypothetical protein
VLGQEERRGGTIEEEEKVRKEGAKKEGRKEAEEADARKQKYGSS